jgi:hypothetical protein
MLTCFAVAVSAVFIFLIIPTAVSGIVKFVSYNPAKDATFDQLYDIIFEVFAPSVENERTEEIIYEKYGRYRTKLNVTQTIGNTVKIENTFDAEYIRGRVNISGNKKYIIPAQKDFLDKRAGEQYRDALRNAPAGTKALVWIAFEEGRTVEQAMSDAEGLNGVETVWLAVKTTDDVESAIEPVLGFSGLPVNRESAIDNIPAYKNKFPYLALSDVDTPAYRERHFKDALSFLKEFDKEAQAILKSPMFDIEAEVDFDKILNYIGEDRLIITGIVLRGFTKEILTLSEQDGLRCTMVEEIVVW